MAEVACGETVFNRLWKTQGKVVARFPGSLPVRHLWGFIRAALKAAWRTGPTGRGQSTQTLLRGSPREAASLRLRRGGDASLLSGGEAAAGALCRVSRHGKAAAFLL